MKRKLLIVSLGFMMGIGLNENIIWTVIVITALFLAYITGKIIFKRKLKAVILFAIALFAGSIYMNSYEGIKTSEIIEYDNKIEQIEGIVYKSETDKYLLKKVKINSKKTRSNIQISYKGELHYGDKINSEVELKIPDTARNEGGFDYNRYLKTKNIYLTGKVKNIKITAQNQLSLIETASEKIREKIRNFTGETLTKDASGILQALITGENDNIEEEMQERYKKAGMIHLLVVSGGHTAFLILLVTCLLKYMKVGVNTSKYILIIVIILYIFITGASPSVLRAGIAVIIVIASELIGRQNDSFTTISTVAIIMLLNNPNMLYSLSFQLSFLGVFGIILGYPGLIEILKKLPKIIREPIALTLSAQLFVTPVTLYNFNTIYLGGLISNIFAMSLAGIIMMAGIILFPVYLIFAPFANILMKAEEFLIFLMNTLATIFSEIPFLNYTLTTPSKFQLAAYYGVLLYLFNFAGKFITNTNMPVKYTNKTNKKAVIVFCGIISILLPVLMAKIIPQSAEITAIDVGHGDSILITTSNRKVILIDTGDAYVYDGKEYDSGKQTVVPYLLDKGYNKIDLLILTHLDSDHTGGLASIAESIDIKAIGVSVNSKYKAGYKEIKEIIEKEKAREILLKKGNKFKVDNAEMEILLPVVNDTVGRENDDSVVILAEIKNTKILLMGDLEASGEEVLLKSNKNLDADILKVGHHGSISSTTEEFVKAVTPKIALISVGTRFSSVPSKVVLERLESADSKVCRTDKMGGIVIKIP